MRALRLLPLVLAALCLAGCGSALFAGPKARPGATSASEETATTATPPAFPDITMKAQAGRVAVIMYHDVIKERDKSSVWFDCTIDEFQKDIDEIVQNGFTVL